MHSVLAGRVVTSCHPLDEEEVTRHVLRQHVDLIAARVE
jgi:hypothetical protein